jgi:transposase-like protein
MEVTSNKVTRILRSRAEIERLLDEQKQSGQNIKSFCASRNVPQASFHNWRKKYSKQAQATGFAAVQITPPDHSSLFAEVQGIKIYQPVSAAYLKELMA